METAHHAARSTSETQQGNGDRPAKLETAAAPQADKQLDAKASRLVKAAQRASDAAKRAYTAGIETTQARAKQVGDVVLENANRATDSSKAFLSKVASKAGHYTDKAHNKASTYKGNVSRAIQLPKDKEGEPLRFPFSVLVWCSTICGRSKEETKDSHQDRELEPETDCKEFSNEFLASTADEYATALEEEATKLEEAIAIKEKKNAPTSCTPAPITTPSPHVTHTVPSSNPKLTPQKSGTT
ncbi:hypothetical protein GOP47_0012406 [Adiantum capillus-veneris]|uniref:Uncharacterized protein n=1 Tax=Adiantum capillus-veneris TaxID=13818 RepID=A0A9D4UQM3_ADICA|nr:hypothetical protein GOP47_0012406 [Adiantum capillus-veneris]